MGFVCNGSAKIEHYLTGKTFEINSDEISWDVSSSDHDRRMGMEYFYTGILEHEVLGTLSWTVSEYPTNVINFGSSTFQMVYRDGNRLTVAAPGLG